MSAQEFKVGDIIRNDDYDRLPIGSVVRLGLGFATWTKASDGLWRDASEVVAADGEIKRFNRTLTHLPDAPEPEDTDDVEPEEELAVWEKALLAEVDVEPEPLKEGDALLIWARVRGFADDRAVHVDITTRHAHALRLVPHADAIVRPDAGQVPPWVKPARCTSLYQGAPTHALWRCDKPEHNEIIPHGTDGSCSTWTTADEAGRITEGGAS